MLFPYKFIAYEKKDGKYTETGRGNCGCDLLGVSRVKAMTGVITNADTFIPCSFQNGGFFKKDGRAVVDVDGTIMVFDIKLPLPTRKHHFEVYAVYNGSVKTTASGELA